jgi:uncharacterized protein
MMTNNPFGSTPAQAGVRPSVDLTQRFLVHAFAWMFAGLLLTAGVAAVVQSSPTLTSFAQRNFLLLFFGQLAIVFAISGLIRRMNATLALGLFFVYAASLGLTVGLIVQAYTQTSVVTAFLSASAMFGGAALYGATTKRSLASLGGFFVMGLIGLLVAVVVNLFLQSSGLSLLISVVGVILFTALTAFDVQRIQNGTLAIAVGSVEKAAVIGALQLYLDFINLFLFLLRLTGSRR